MRKEWPSDLSQFVEVDEECAAIDRAAVQLVNLLPPNERAIVHNERRYIRENGKFSSTEARVLMRAVIMISIEHVRRDVPLTLEAVRKHQRAFGTLTDHAGGNIGGNYPTPAGERAANSLE
jgi:hypothetical protein